MKQKERAREEVVQNPASDEVTKYFAAQHRLSCNVNPLSFWVECTEKYPNLAVLSQDILVIPATSSPVQRLFSQTTIATSGKRNRLSIIKR